MGHAQERPAGHVHRLQEAVAADVDDAAMQGLLRRKSDRMKQEVELAPLLLDIFEDAFHLSFDHHVKRHEKRSLEHLRQRLDVFLRLFVQISYGQIGAERTKCLGAAPCDRLVIGDADDQALAALERDLGLGKNRDAHDVFSLAWVDGCLLDSSASVCWAIIDSSSVGMT